MTTLYLQSQATKKLITVNENSAIVYQINRAQDCISLVTSQGFTLQNSPRNIHLFYKAELYVWEYFGIANPII